MHVGNAMSIKPSTEKEDTYYQDYNLMVHSIIATSEEKTAELQQAINNGAAL